MKQSIIVLWLGGVLFSCTPSYHVQHIQYQGTHIRTLGDTRKYFSKKDLLDVDIQLTSLFESKSPCILIRKLKVKKYQGRWIGLFTVMPQCGFNSHSTSYEGKIFKFADTLVVNYNGHKAAKNILKQSEILGTVHYFKQLYGDQFDPKTLEKIESSFYKGVLITDVRRGYFKRSEEEF